MKKILFVLMLYVGLGEVHSQGFYTIAHAVDSLYPNDTTEDGPKATIRRIKQRWEGQINAQGTFSTAAQNYKNFATGLVNFRTATSNCTNFEPTWEEIGPRMEANNSNGMAGAGLIHRITFHPQYDGVTNTTLFAMSGFGGMWKSVDDGENWVRIKTDIDIPFSNLGVLVIDPTNPDRMYVTTGTPGGAPDVSYVAMMRDFPLYTLGIYGTDNGGVSWTKINTGISTTLTDFGGSIYNMQMDPTDHNNLIFTSTDGVYYCSNASSALTSISWTKSTQFNTLSGNDDQIVGLTYNPTTNQWFVSGKKIYSAYSPFTGGPWSLSSGPSSGLDLSGGTYPFTSDPIVRINVANSLITGQTNEVYALIFAGTDKIGIAKKVGTGNWYPIKYFTGYAVGTYGRSADKTAIVAFPGSGTSPNNTDFYIGNNSYYYYNSSTSTATGNYPNNNMLHADIQALYIHPTQTNKVWVASDGGVSLKLKSTGTFSTGASYKNKGIQAQLLWDFDDSEQDYNYRLAALQDNGTQYIGGLAGAQWKTAFFWGDGYGSQIFNKNPTDALVRSGTWDFSAFDYSSGTVTSGLPLYGYAEGDDYFANPDPSYSAEKVFIGGYFLNGTTGSGTNWQQTTNYANTTITLNYNSTSFTFSNCLWSPFKTTYQNGAGAPAYFITKSRACSNINRPSIIAKSTNGYNFGTTWNDNYFSNINQITNALYDQAKLDNVITSADYPLLSGIACKPEDGSKVWVSSSGLLPNFKVYKSTDGGTTWSNADPNHVFAKIPVFDIVAVEGSLDLVFAATLDGVYYNDNTMNGNWCRYGESPSVQTLKLKINPCKNKLIVSTYGRGAFEVNLPFQPVASTNVTTTTWSSVMHFPNTSVVVKAGNTLTIQNTTIYFGPNSRLYVEAGAKLVINNATLTNESGCNGYLWKGIELQGDLNQKQVLSGPYYPNHGWCVMSNNATVKNAEIGVKNFASVNGDGWTIDWSKMGGGIIQSTNGKFLNCGEGAKFITYINKNVLNQPTTDKSFFTTTQFLTDASTAIANYLPGTHLAMWGTKGIAITSNTFKNVTPSSYAISKRGYGIVAYDAAFSVSTPCTAFNPTTGQCTTYGTPNTFENLYYGVDAGASLATVVVNISAANFTNNHRGIILRGTTQSTAFKNNIAIGDAYTEPSGAGTGMVTSLPYGLYLDVCDAYHITENVFTDASGTTPDTDYGIIVSNTGLNTNELRKNTFSNTAFGIQAQEENYGLQLKCNKFTASTIKNADVNIMGLAMQGSIAQQQGLCSQNATDLPGNEFSHTCSVAKDLTTNSNVLYQVTYNTRTSITAETPQAGCYNTTDYLVNGCFPVPSGEVCPPPTGGGFGGRMAQSNPDKELSDMGQLITAKQQLLDDGNTAQLHIDIASATDENMLKQSLLQKGPYLSDQALLGFIHHTPAYSAATLKEVLVNNSPLEPTVMAAVNALNLGTKIKSQIDAYQSGMSQRTSLEREIRYLKTSRVLLYNNIINAILNDTLNPSVYDTLYTKLNFSISPQSRYLYIGALLDQGNYTQAGAELATLRQSGEKADNCDYLEALITLKQQPDKAQSYKSTTGISSKIDPLLSQWPLGRSVNAHVLHNSLFGTKYQEKIYIDEATASEQRLALKEEVKTLIEEENFQVLTFPNPAQNEITFMVDRGTEENDCDITIYDVNGKLMTNFTIKENKTPKTILLNNYSSGVYFYKAVSGGKVIQNKLVIIK